MNQHINKKFFAIGVILLLITSGSIAYLFVSSQQKSNSNSNNSDDNVNEDIITTTIDSPQTPEAQIKAGPLIGYAPLTVQFLGNPTNDSNIVSYHWIFGPQSTPIVPQSSFNKIPNFQKLFILLFAGYTLSILTANLEKSFLLMGILFASTLLYMIYYLIKTKISSEYESTEQNPTMVFPFPGSYSATLTITDSQGNTTSDIIWITALRYIHPDNDD